MVPVCSSVMLELVLAVHSYHVIAYPGKIQKSNVEPELLKILFELGVTFFFICVLRPVKIISLILSRINLKAGRKREIPEKHHLTTRKLVSHMTRARLEPTAVR